MYKVYEVDKGWGFDGMYIPHMAELNWSFADNPFDNRQVQKVRIHGLSKGLAKLQVSANTLESDSMDFEPYYTEPQIVDLPQNPTLIKEDLYPTTNYVDSANRGVGLQLKFEGRNEDTSLPEPPHVLQVLMIQSTTSGHREN